MVYGHATGFDQPRPDVHIHRLFNEYSVRIWGLGMADIRANSVDFIDPAL